MTQLKTVRVRLPWHKLKQHLNQWWWSTFDNFPVTLNVEINCARNYDNLLNFVKVMPKILVVPFFPNTVYIATSDDIDSTPCSQNIKTVIICECVSVLSIDVPTRRSQDLKVGGDFSGGLDPAPLVGGCVKLPSHLTESWKPFRF